MIRVESLVKIYGKVRALDGLSFSVPERSIFGFVGPNGAGKTTTLKILATLLLPDSGKAWIAGSEVSVEPDQVKKNLGYMPDFFGVYSNLKANEYLEFYAQACGIPAARAKPVAKDLLELMDLSHKAGEFVEALSRGMKQRLCLARALVHDPPVLLLDEPASGLDPRARIEMRELLRELSTMGKTILISSHILSELAELCTNIGIIDQGRLVASGTIRRGLGSSPPKKPDPSPTASTQPKRSLSESSPVSSLPAGVPSAPPAAQPPLSAGLPAKSGTVDTSRLLAKKKDREKH